ncbi:hypothetical protein SMSKK35_4010 [Stenotrophomonas maltophilia SKK35]|nr:hypothetical protein SMSKK35_4010 [Stenotrophomonas maltophilia SKK35]
MRAATIRLIGVGVCVPDAGSGIWTLPASGRHYLFFLGSART